MRILQTAIKLFCVDEPRPAQKTQNLRMIFLLYIQVVEITKSSTSDSSDPAPIAAPS